MLKKRLRNISLMCSLLGVLSISLGCSYMPPVMQKSELDVENISAVFGGRTVLSQETKTAAVSVSYYSKNGKIQQFHDGNLRTGKWSVDEKGHKCLQMNAEEEECRVVMRDADNLYNAYNSNYFSVRPAVVYHSFISGNTLKGDSTLSSKKIKTKYDNMAVQKVLTNKGYSPGPIDGVWGARSRQALLKFQTDNGLEKTGQPNIEVMEEISKR